jgi:hypothetical protein
MAAAPLTGWAQIGVSSLSTDLNIAPGGSVSGSFEVTNNSQQSRQFTVAVKDYDRGSDCGLILLSPGTHPRSLARFLFVTPLTFSLDPGQKQSIAYNIKIPNGAVGPHWAAVVVTSPLPASSPQGPISITQNEQFIIKIRQTDPTNAVNNGRLIGMQVLPPDKDQPLRVMIDYQNIGTTFQQPTGQLQIIDAGGRTVATVNIDPFPVLPSGECKLEIPMPQNLPSGDYLALAILDFGGDFLLGGQAQFKVP